MSDWRPSRPRLGFLWSDRLISEAAAVAAELHFPIATAMEKVGSVV